MRKFIVDVMYLFVTVVLLFVWCLVGLAYWIPLLVKATALFTGSVIHSVIRGDVKEAGNGSEALQRAVSFLPIGFASIIDAAHRRWQPDNGRHVGNLRVGRLFGETLWAVAVWSVVLWLRT